MGFSGQSLLSASKASVSSLEVLRLLLQVSVIVGSVFNSVRLIKDPVDLAESIDFEFLDLLVCLFDENTVDDEEDEDLKLLFIVPIISLDLASFI